MMKSKKRFFLFTIVLLTVSLNVCVLFAATERLTIVTGGTAGVWYAGGAVMAKIWNNNVSDLYVTATDGGSMSNIKAVAKGTDAQIGMTWAPAYYLAKKKIGLFENIKNSENLSVIANFMMNYGPYWIVRKDSNIKSISDFKGKRILPGYTGSGMEYFNNQILNIAGVGYDAINGSGGKVMFADYGEAANLMKDGHIDAFCLVGPARHGVALSVQSVHPIQVVGIEKDVRDKFYQKFDGFLDRTITKGTYKGQAEDVTCVGYHSILIVSSKLDAELVYKMTKSLFANTGQLVNTHKIFTFVKPENATIGLKWDDLHPGAQKYFQEIGLKK